MQKIAIIGKPNVGKSTLFNRIIKKNKSIVHDTPGVTRDRIYSDAEWLNRNFILIDTGGLTISDFDFKENIKIQVEYAINEADKIIFLVSSKDGIDKDDFFIAKMLKKIKNKKIFLAVNKSESNKSTEFLNDFYKLGFGEPVFISSSHGIGVGDLLDIIVENNKLKAIKENKDFPIAIIGRPNVGKSSLVNAILNEERVIVSDIAGTTRDAIDTSFSFNKNDYTIIDTAGIRRKGKVKESIEKYSVLRVEQSIKRAKVLLLILDSSEEFNELDEVIGGLVFSANIPSIIVVNKWDLVEKDTYTMNNYIKILKSRFKFLSWSPIIFVSAKENKRVKIIFKEIEKIRENLNKQISASILTDVIIKAQMMNNTPSNEGGRLRINYVTQVEGQIPTFVLFCNNPKFLHFSYARYLENTLRESFGFDNIPITLYFKSKNSRTRKKEH
ncbi:MAG: ribosome biogenesis GTPase Der [Mycoplasmoidaceae bacterium]